MPGNMSAVLIGLLSKLIPLDWKTLLSKSKCSPVTRSNLNPLWLLPFAAIPQCSISFSSILYKVESIEHSTNDVGLTFEQRGKCEPALCRSDVIFYFSPSCENNLSNSLMQPLLVLLWYVYFLKWNRILVHNTFVCNRDLCFWFASEYFHLIHLHPSFTASRASRPGNCNFALRFIKLCNKTGWSLTCAVNML